MMVWTMINRSVGFVVIDTACKAVDLGCDFRIGLIKHSVVNASPRMWHCTYAAVDLVLMQQSCFLANSLHTLTYFKRV